MERAKNYITLKLIITMKMRTSRTMIIITMNFN